MNKKEKTLIILGIVFISFNLRSSITAVGSVVEMIQSQYALSGSAAGFITTLPLIAFAVVSPFVANFNQKLGYGKSMAVGLLLIMAGILIRSYTNSLGLFVGTALLGVGIAIGNVLIPGIIKMKFPNNIGIMTSIYITGMCTFAAVGAGLSIPLTKGLDLGWENALAFWFIPAVITFIFWSPQLKNKENTAPIIKDTDQNKATSIWKSTTAWWVAVYMGTQSILFYSLVAWLPTIVISKGMSDSFAGNMAFTFQLLAIPATLMLPILCVKFKTQCGLVLIVCSLYLSGMALFIFSQSQTLIFLSMLLLALGQGGSISLATAFISLRSPNAKRASELSGMSQSAGYLLATIGPILMGFLYDSLETWTLPLFLCCGLIFILAFVGYFAGKDVLTDVN